MKIIAISGSLKSTSSNTAILRAMATMAGKDDSVTLFGGLGNLPHFSPEIDGDKSPASVLEYRKQLRSSDGIIICTPEYAYGMPGVLKNALDWVVGSGEFVDKPVAAISASPSFLGGDKAHASLVLTLGAINARVAEGAQLTIPAIRNKINSNAEILDPELTKQLRAVLDALIRAIKTN
ncbi:MAG TPA: NADPH-dependent FMN reductase [Cytophagaceae bacterium]|nr:NADPH-dependent FMN reductase [Cytophagaceae bacterium]